MAEDLSPHERRRIIAILDAAVANDWNDFVRLSDNGFQNIDAMREQFLESATLLVNGYDGWENDVHLAILEDDTRLIYVFIPSSEPERGRVNLTIHSESAGQDAEIDIWTFFEWQTFV